MKKLYVLLLVAAIIFAFAGCSKKGTANVDVDASSETTSETSENVKSDVMPDTESKAGDVVIDINELLDESDSGSSRTDNSTSTSQTNSSSEVSIGSGNSSITSSSSNNITSKTAGESQLVSQIDSGTGFTSGWVYK